MSKAPVRRGPPPAPRHVASAPPPDPAAVLAAAEAEEALEREALEDLAPAEKPALGPARTVAEEEALKVRVADYRARFGADLSEADILEALGLARDQVQEVRRQNAIKELIKTEKARLKMEEGLVTGISVLDDLIEIEVDCQPWQSPIVLNGVGYYRNKGYKVPRHVANMILEMCDRGRRADRDMHGESWDDFYRKPHQTVFSAVKGVVDGALDPRVAA